MLNFKQTIISQYRSSPVLLALLESINEWLDPNANLENFYNFIWNVDIAIGAGLDVWGRIVNVKRTLTLTTTTDHYDVFFGFGEAGDRTGFGQAPFYAGQPEPVTSTTTANFVLTDAAYRLLIFAKAAYNITDGSIPAINALLMNLFPDRGNAYVTDGGEINGPSRPFGFGEAGDRAPFGWGAFADDYAPSVPTTNMTMVYVFDFPLEPFEVAIVVNSGALPKPTGVKATSRYLT